MLGTAALMGCNTPVPDFFPCGLVRNADQGISDIRITGASSEKQRPAPLRPSLDTINPARDFHQPCSSRKNWPLPARRDAAIHRAGRQLFSL
ncbi:MAG: hypothetical protein WDA70_07000 [Lysobacteraceae bacterium]